MVTPARRYAEGLADWRAERAARRRCEIRQQWRTLDRDHWADRFADPERGLSYFDRVRNDIAEGNVWPESAA